MLPLFLIINVLRPLHVVSISPGLGQGVYKGIFMTHWWRTRDVKSYVVRPFVFVCVFARTTRPLATLHLPLQRARPTQSCPPVSPRLTVAAPRPAPPPLRGPQSVRIPPELWGPGLKAPSNHAKIDPRGIWICQKKKKKSIMRHKKTTFEATLLWRTGDVRKHDAFIT